jgi:hypothetical protein
MRWLLVFGLVCLPVLATAKPRIAVAPLEGDAGGKVTEVVAKAADDAGNVTSGPDATRRAMAKLGVEGELDGKAVKKLRKRLDVHVLIHGTVAKAGGRKMLELSVSVRGEKTERFSITFKNARDKKLARALRDELRQRLSEGEGNDDDEASEDRAPKRRKKQRHRDDDDAPVERHPITQAAVRIGVGTAPTRRTLTFDTSSSTPPPSIGTLSFSGRVEAEVYPASFATLEGLAARLGLALEVDKTFGLGIDNPGAGGASVSIDKLFVEVGARYRIPVGQHAIALGASYYRRRYRADRAGAGATLDMPDVDYTAVAANAVGRFALGPKAALVVALDVPLMLDAGPIQSSQSYGPAHILAFDLDAGVEYRLAPRYALAASLELSNIMVSFDGKAGSQADTRSVSGATDRNLGVALALELLY